MSLDDLSGRELDAAIARQFFGFQVEERINTRTKERDFVRPTPSGNDWVVVPYYSTGSASLDLELELKDHGWTRTAPWGPVTGESRVVLRHADGGEVEAVGRSLKEAIARAALEAAGSDRPGI